MKSKAILPWLNEIITDSGSIQQLIDQHALEEWYSLQSEQKPGIEKKESKFTVLLHEKRRLRSFIQKLSPIERVIVYLRYWENLLIHEISKLIEISEGQVNQILNESIKKLRAIYSMESEKPRLPEYIYA